MIAILLWIWFIGLLFAVGFLLEDLKTILPKAHRNFSGNPVGERVVALTVMYVVVTLAMLLAWPVFLGEKFYKKWKGELKNWDQFGSN